MKTLLAFLSAYPGRSAVVLAALFAAALAEGLSLTTLLPLLSATTGTTTSTPLDRFVLERLHWLGIEPTIGMMLGIIVACFVLKSLLLLVSNREVGYAVAHVATDLRLELIDALLASRWQYYLRRQTGALANSIATEAYRAATAFQHGSNVLASSLQATLYLYFACLVSWEATVVSVLVGSIFIVILHRLVRSARRAGQNQTQMLRSLLAFLTDFLGSVKALKAMARDNVADAVLRDQTRQLEAALRREVITRETLRALQEPIMVTLGAIGLYIALVQWGLTLTSVLMLVLLLVRLLTLLNKVQRFYQQMTTQESAYWALRQAAEQARAEAETATGTLPPTLDSAIELRGLQFSHERQAIFTGLDLRIDAGSFTAVTGSSGLGKSTFLDLLCGLVEAQVGDILIDGTPLRDLDRRRWRRMIGYVAQDTVLLHDTIQNNVTAGEVSLTAADAERALQQAGAWEFIVAMPDGMNTVVGERGGLLSGGQRQRIALARALAHQPRLLILDEPTSALDPESERLICEQLRSLAGKLTIIVVSHQAALLRAADRVITFEDGRARTVPRGAGHPGVSSTAPG